MVERDSSDEFIMDIMDELMEVTMTTIHKKYIERQLLPFTITQARDAIIEIIEVSNALLFFLYNLHIFLFWHLN